MHGFAMKLTFSSGHGLRDIAELRKLPDPSIGARRSYR
jgi:hypothetical protein